MGHSEETKKKISIAHIGKEHSEEVKKKMSLSHYKSWVVRRKVLDFKIFSYFVADIESDQCWIWSANHRKIVTSRKYGQHRRVFELLLGPIPPGLFVCHSCDVKLCVRPSHFFLGTSSDNALDAVKKGLLSNQYGRILAKNE